MKLVPTSMRELGYDRQPNCSAGEINRDVRVLAHAPPQADITKQGRSTTCGRPRPIAQRLTSSTARRSASLLYVASPTGSLSATDTRNNANK